MMERRMRLERRGEWQGHEGWGEEERGGGGVNPKDWSCVALAGEGNSVSL